MESRLAGCCCELALGDSCEEALNFANTVLPQTVKFLHLDLLDLQFESRYNVVFLLEVLERVDDDGRALMEVAKALKPGGFAVLTVPALRFFWSFNDEVAHHKRRYDGVLVEQLAKRADLKIRACRYFMFFLSPIYWAYRFVAKPRRGVLSQETVAALLAAAHRVPWPMINELLYGIFALEASLSRLVVFPWGTSLLAILQKSLRTGFSRWGYGGGRQLK